MQAKQRRVARHMVVYSVVVTMVVIVACWYILTRPLDVAPEVIGQGHREMILDWPEWGNDEVGEVAAGVHPIEFLMEGARKKFTALMKEETYSLQKAADQYRKRRGRHPPPGFDAWHRYAVSMNATIIEPFWDQIYADLEPFWSISPVELRKQAHVFSPKITIRSRTVHAHMNNVYSKLDIWADLLANLAGSIHFNVPDMDIPFSANDEPAIMAPWEVIDTALSFSRRMFVDPRDAITTFDREDKEDLEKLTEGYTFDPEWLGPRLTHPASHLGPRPLWSLVRPACPPESPARKEHLFQDIWDPEGDTKEEHSPTALLPLELPEGTLQGYIKNWTTAADACVHPNLQGIHGAFVAPNQMNIATKLFPIFGDSKMAFSNEILIPGAMEWNVTDTYRALDSVLWEEKEPKMFWRGSATTGNDPERYWKRFHRQRLVSMLNATHIEIAEASIHSGNESTVGVGYAKNFRLLPANEYHLKSQTGGRLAEWVNGWADAAFTDLKCVAQDEQGSCTYLNEYFSISEDTHKHEDSYKYAVTIDDDGGDDGGSFTRNLLAGRVTLRASIYKKWYDSRLTPWLHFVPMDNTFVDLYGIMEFFVGSSVSEASKPFSHAVGEVQHHEHHFKTPGAEIEEELREQADIEHPDHGLEDSEDAPHVHPEAHHISPPEAKSFTGNEPHEFETSNHRISTRDTDGHDDAAKKIAEAGKQWANSVLRKEDMLIYVYRLLLEYARVVDDRRERLAWVEDWERFYKT